MDVGTGSAIPPPVHVLQHKVLKASPGAAIFERDMLFDIPFKAAWKQIGEYRLHQTDYSNKRENSSRVDYDYKSVIQY
jgi:hypothetical protein